MRKKRGYKRDIPKEMLRDYKLFALACEGGKREPAYFEFFEKMSNRVKVDVIKEEGETEKHKYATKSSPKWVLNRAVEYVEKKGLSYEDDLWFIMDIDKWQMETLREIANYCKDKPNWHIVLSNPCFEVWLYFHQKANFSNIEMSCSDIKKELHLEISGDLIKLLPNLYVAIENAKKTDTNINHFWTNKCETKIYLLAEALLKFIGKTTFETFLKQN